MDVGLLVGRAPCGDFCSPSVMLDGGAASVRVAILAPPIPAGQSWASGVCVSGTVMVPPLLLRQGFICLRLALMSAGLKLLMLLTAEITGMCYLA